MTETELRRVMARRGAGPPDDLEELRRKKLTKLNYLYYDY